VQKTVLREGANKGRQFWGCPNHESARCKYFEWDDEPPRDNMGLGTGGSNGGFGGGFGDELSGGFGGGFGGGSRIQDGAMNGGGAGECFRCGEAGHWSNGESPSLESLRL
jgi:DNA topoisomerase III